MGNGAIYAETNYSGVLTRYTNFPAPDAESGLSITYNTASSFPTFSGCYGTYTNTFVIKDDWGYDCPGNDTPSNANVPGFATVYIAPDDAYLTQVNDIVYAYDLPRNENTDCGKNPPSSKPAPHIIAANPNITSALTIAPNPADNEINVSLINEKLKGGILKIYDNMGRLVQRIQVSDGLNVEQVDISQLANGVYQVNLESADGSVFGGKFTKN
jgi:hypothetical protein